MANALHASRANSVNTSESPKKKETVTLTKWGHTYCNDISSRNINHEATSKQHAEMTQHGNPSGMGTETCDIGLIRGPRKRHP